MCCIISTDRGPAILNHKGETQYETSHRWKNKLLQKTEEYSKEQVQNLQYTREQLQKAENKLRSDAISSYADTVQKLNIKIETGFLNCYLGMLHFSN